jgi:hypothetical protein
MAVRTKTNLLQVEDKNNNSGWDELSRLLIEYLTELDGKDKDNEDLQIH